MLKTEMRNEKTMHVDKMTTVDMVKIMNEENMNAVRAVEKCSNEIALAIDLISDAFAKSGRLFYVGAGTSGRLGIMDAAECPPTFGVDYNKVIGIIAGGEKAMTKAQENVEDDGEAGAKALESNNLSSCDVVVGISAAGGAKYVINALQFAKSIGCGTICITSNEDTGVTKVADISIITDTGAEVITGSTRLKAGTAQKLVLNMLSTFSMVKSGYVYENLMINLRPTNIKLRKRMIGIVCSIKGVNEEVAQKLLDENDWNIRNAVQ